MPHESDQDEKGKWVKRTHPQYDTWHDDQERMRATLHARRRDLAHYLVPHRFEADEDTRKKPEKLDRADLGYGISLNESYLHDIKGHVRSAESRYDWGPLGGDEDTNEPPENTTARLLWEDATRQNTDWREFFEVDVLGWMLSSPGSLIVADVPAGRQSIASDDADRRPYVRNVPLSEVWDIGRGPRGLRYVKLHEVRDTRSFMDDEGGFSENVLVYWLQDGTVKARRWDLDGNPLHEEIDMGRLTDRQGDPTLPVVLNTFGRHPDIPWLGAGLLVGLDDITIDLFNATNEMRAGYRDLVIAFLAFRGSESQAGEIRDALDSGTRFVHLGDEDNAELKRVAAEASEVDAGISQMEVALRAWQESAKRKAADAMTREMSGKALQAEFQLDLAPLLREVTGRLDNVESSVMHRLAQLDDEGVRSQQIESIGVERNREFRPEDEASRIARLVDEFRQGWGLVPAEPKARMVMRWLEATEAVDLDQDVETGTGETRPLRELLPSRIEELAEMDERRLRQQGELAGPLVRDAEA